MAHPNAATPEEMRALIAARRSDDPSWFQYGDLAVDPAFVVGVLKGHMTDARRSEIETVLDHRTRDVVVVVDGMVDMGNVSAIMRTAEAFGIQEVHAIDTADTYKRSRRTTRGADKWIDRYRWEDAESCFGHLVSAGYRIVVADATPSATPLDDAELTDRIAIVFGNEREGISSPVRTYAERTIAIPTEGFVESLNVSVAASVVLHEIHRQRVRTYGGNGDLAPDDRDRVRAVWYYKSVRASESIVERAIISDGVATPSHRASR